MDPSTSGRTEPDEQAQKLLDDIRKLDGLNKKGFVRDFKALLAARIDPALEKLFNEKEKIVSPVDGLAC